MKILGIKSTAALFVAVLTFSSTGLFANERINWMTDPTCQAMYFAVLEGMFTDGVTNDEADSMLKGENYVYTCPLCDATRNAVNAYRSRPEFMNLKGRVDTFGKGVGEVMHERLISTDRTMRMIALEAIVQKWVGKRLDSMRLTEAEREDWRSKLAVRRKLGMMALESISAKQVPGWKACALCDACAKAGGVACERPAVMPFGELKPATAPKVEKKVEEKKAAPKEKETF